MSQVNGRNRPIAMQPTHITRTIVKIKLNKRERNVRSLRITSAQAVKAKPSQPKDPTVTVALVKNGSGCANPENISSHFGTTRKRAMPQIKYAAASIHE